MTEQDKAIWEGMTENWWRGALTTVNPPIVATVANTNTIDTSRITGGSITASPYDPKRGTWTSVREHPYLPSYDEVTVHDMTGMVVDQFVKKREAPGLKVQIKNVPKPTMLEIETKLEKERVAKEGQEARIKLQQMWLEKHHHPAPKPALSGLTRDWNDNRRCNLYGE